MPATQEAQHTSTAACQQYLWDGSKPVRATADDEGAVIVRNVVGDIKWDTITPTFNATEDVYVFSFDGDTTATITVSYTDATKEVLAGVTKVLA